MDDAASAAEHAAIAAIAEMNKTALRPARLERINKMDMKFPPE